MTLEPRKLPSYSVGLHYNPSHSPSSLSRFGTPSGPPSEPNRTERDEDGKDDNVNERSDTVGNGQQHNDPFR